MRRLVFIDDDQIELDAFGRIIAGNYEYTTIHWPSESGKLFDVHAPDIFVSDLYLPPRSGDTVPTTAQRKDAAQASTKVAGLFDELYAEKSLDDKARLQRTMIAITEAYKMLGLQWRALGQSPDHGVALLQELKARYPEVPFVFYSRKITPEDVVCVFKAGAVDAVRKSSLENSEVLARLELAQNVFQRPDLRSLRAQGLNVNITLLS